MALPTWVDSLNGYTGNLPFQQDPMITLDADDIHLWGSTGTTVKSQCQSLASGIRMLELQGLADEGDYRMRIGSYPLSLVNGG